MAAKILMNKNTLAALKIELSEFRDALPVFEMKEQQLKGIVQAIESGIKVLTQDIAKTNEEIKSWVAVMAEDGVDVDPLAMVEQVITEEQEIVGVTVENFVEIRFKKADLNFFTSPLWAADAVEAICAQKTNHTILVLEQEKIARLRKELAEARRMKNALQEVFIPETTALIRKIEIYLGDVERLSIGCAKLVKKKKQEKTATT